MEIWSLFLKPFFLHKINNLTPASALVYYWGDSLIHPMLIIASYLPIPVIFLRETSVITLWNKLVIFSVIILHVYMKCVLQTIFWRKVNHLFGFPTVNFGPLFRVQLHSPEVIITYNLPLQFKFFGKRFVTTLTRINYFARRYEVCPQNHFSLTKVNHLRYHDFFRSAIWLPYCQLWAIIARTTFCLSLLSILSFFYPKVTWSLVPRFGPKAWSIA